MAMNTLSNSWMKEKFLTGFEIDETGRLVMLSCIDNLVKGASGQAIQNMNILLGIDEKLGLTHFGLHP